MAQDLRDAIVDYARSFMGTPYVWGGTSPVSGWDCSEFVHFVYKHFGLHPAGIDENSATLWQRYYEQRTELPHKAGLAFWDNGQGSTSRIVHVGLIAGETFVRNLDGLWQPVIFVIEASGPGRHCRSIEEAIKHKACVKERPLLYPRGSRLTGYVDPLLIDSSLHLTYD